MFIPILREGKIWKNRDDYQQVKKMTNTSLNVEKNPLHRVKGYQLILECITIESTIIISLFIFQAATSGDMHSLKEMVKHAQKN